MRKILLITLIGIFFVAIASADTEELTMKFIVPDERAPQFISIDGNESVEYGTEWDGADFEAEDLIHGMEDWLINDTDNFEIFSPPGMPNYATISWKGQLGVNNYYINVSARNSIGNINSTIYNLNITENTGSCDVLFNETSPLQEGESFRVYSNCNSAFTLYRNGTIVSNNSVQTLDGGTYNFSVVRTDTQNYSNTYDDEFFVIEEDTTPEWDNLRNFITYINENFSESITATSGVGISCYYLNDTSKFDVDCDGLITNSVPLSSVEKIYLTITVNNTLGEEISGEFYIDIRTTGTYTLCLYRKYGFYNLKYMGLKEELCV